MNVSIIVPVYRAEQYLDKCIKSILRQDEPDIELILVDDGSPDRSGEICDAYAGQDSRIRVIHQKNGGVSSARNAGIAAARGEYIVFIDSDDYVEPAYVSALLRARRSDPDAGHIWCCFQTVDSYNHENAKPNYESDQRIKEFDRAEIMTLHDLWLDAGPVCKLYRTDILQKEGIRFDESLSLGEDWMFNLAYLDAVESTGIQLAVKPLYNYVQLNAESLDQKYRPDMLEIYRKLNQTCESYLQKWGVSEEQMQRFYNSRFYSYDKVMRNTMRNPDISRGSAVRQNNRLILSEEFQEVYKKADCYMHRFYRRAYEKGRFRLILMTDRLAPVFGHQRRRKA